MPPKNISSYSDRAIALIVLSKMLYGMTAASSGSEELRAEHRRLLNESLVSLSPDPEFDLSSIPWDNLLDSIVRCHPYICVQADTGLFTLRELRYMAAIICGLSGKEFGIITGYRSHYNLSWSIRQKLNQPAGSYNLRTLLHDLYEKTSDMKLSIALHRNQI